MSDAKPRAHRWAAAGIALENIAGAKACHGGTSGTSHRDWWVLQHPALPLYCSPGFQGGGQSSGPSQLAHLPSQSNFLCGCMWVWGGFVGEGGLFNVRLVLLLAGQHPSSGLLRDVGTHTTFAWLKLLVLSHSEKQG